jgi:Protein of unknown function (DUF3024)
MALTPDQVTGITSAMDDFMARRRPPVELRDRLDHGWRIEGQSVLIFSARSLSFQPGTRIEEPIAKATFVRTTHRWKIFWMRADGKWHGYPALPEALLFEEFLREVDEDPKGCFWG